MRQGFAVLCQLSQRCVHLPVNPSLNRIAHLADVALGLPAQVSQQLRRVQSYTEEENDLLVFWF